MINFYPQKVPFFKALKLLFTRRVWLAVQLNEFGQPTACQVGYDRPKGAQPLTQEVIEQQRQMAQEAQERAAATATEVEAEPAPLPEQKPPPMFSTRYAPPPKNRKQRRQESREAAKERRGRK